MSHNICKKFFDSTIGIIEVVDEVKDKIESKKYCEENDGMLIPLHNQEIVDEVSHKLYNCFDNEKQRYIERQKFIWRVGLDCKNGSYIWQDGKPFIASNYQRTSFPRSECKDIFLTPNYRGLYSCCFDGSVPYEGKTPFMCLKNKRLDQRIVNSAPDFYTGNETTITDNSVAIGFSVCLFLLLVIICGLILKIIRQKKKQKLLANELKLQNQNNILRNTINEHFNHEVDTLVNGYQVRKYIIPNVHQDTGYIDFEHYLQPIPINMENKLES